GQCDVFDRSECTVTGVVDQHVDASVLSDDASDQRGERSVVGDVESHGNDAILCQRGHQLDPARYRIDDVARSVQPAGDGRADTRRGSGDDGDWGGHEASTGKSSGIFRADIVAASPSYCAASKQNSICWRLLRWRDSTSQVSCVIVRCMTKSSVAVSRACRRGESPSACGQAKILAWMSSGTPRRAANRRCCCSSYSQP